MATTRLRCRCRSPLRPVRSGCCSRPSQRACFSASKTMAYRNRRFPFTGSMGADVMIGTVAAYALVAVVLTHFGRPLARYAPGIFTYFSFQDEMGWNYTFYEGNVGPFQIGQDEN